MKPEQAWKNFNLGQELSVSGAFIYNGLRRFHEMRVLDHTDEVFEFLYNLSVGLERLLKIAVVLLEHDTPTNQEDLEESLITHNHLDLLHRVRKNADVKLGPSHNEFLSLLGRFYKSGRYARFTLASVHDMGRERDALCEFLAKHLGVEFDDESLFGTQNTDRYRKFIQRLVVRISGELFKLVRETASSLNLYTYELRSGSRAETIFLGQGDISSEDVLWKELLIFFINTDARSGVLDFLRSIDPLDFDPGLANDYLECFQSDAAKASVVGELETLYDDLPDVGERLELMKVVGNQNVVFDDPSSEEEWS